MLDGERDAEIRKKIVFSLAQMNNQKARAKLMDIVRGSDDALVRQLSDLFILHTLLRRDSNRSAIRTPLPGSSAPPGDD